MNVRAAGTEVLEPIEVPVPIRERPYSVWVGPGLLERAAGLVPLPDACERLALVADPAAGEHHGRRAEQGLRATGREVRRFDLPGGEESKTFACVERLLRWMTVEGFHRHDMVYALGGGVAGDLAGFAAATFHRGIALANAPTTVLSQVDAAIGGKTGVNLPEGKNVAGAFHQPAAVVADTATLATLPEPELVSGLAEVVKHGFIGDPGLLEDLQAAGSQIRARDQTTLQGVIARAAAVKARVVAADEREDGERAHLNYGHTLGHALEAAGGYRRWRHGEAVAIGMVFAARLAALLGYPDQVAAHRRALEAVGLPTGGAGIPLEDLAPLLARDKKHRGGTRFVVLEEIGRARLVEDVAEDHVRRAYEEVR